MYKVAESAAKMREQRASALMSQDDAARAMGVSRSTVSAWERARRVPRVSQLVGMADAYGCRVEDLVCR